MGSSSDSYPFSSASWLMRTQMLDASYSVSPLSAAAAVLALLAVCFAQRSSYLVW